MHPLDGPIGHGIGEVVGVVLVVELGGGADDLLVLGQAGVPLARPAAEDSVEVVEPPAVRPTVEWAGGSLLAIGCEMPFAEDGRAVAVVPENPRKRRAVAWQDRRIPRKPTGELTDGAETDGVVVPPGQQARRGWASTAR